MNNTKVKLQLASTLTLAFALFVIVIVILSSCEPRDSNEYASDHPWDTQVEGLIAPIQLNVDSTLIYLSDYFDGPLDIQSVKVVEADVEIHLNEDMSMWIYPTQTMPPLVELEIIISGQRRSIILKKSKLRKYDFSYDAQGKQYESVQMKGEMNSWNVNAQELVERDGIYSAELLLEPKSYQYIMVLDGKETLDQNNSESVSNGMGGFNSVLEPFGDGITNPVRLLTSTVNEMEVVVSTSTKVDEAFVLWQNYLLPAQVEDAGIHFQIPGITDEARRSFIRVVAYKGDVISNDVLIPLQAGKVLSSVDELNRMDEHAMVLYNVFVDRFYNGDPSNDRPLSRPDVHPRADNHGGDIKGATQKIKEGYFEKLGINTIWISPIVKNVEGAYGLWPDPKTKFSAYHGYWPISFTLVDDRMGTEEDLHELVTVAHENNMNVLLDFVANHIHEKHPFYVAHPEVATDLYLPDGRMNTELWDEQRLTTWFDVFLPSLRLDDPFVYEMLTDSAVYWIREYDLDGFRHDATKHVPEIFWRTLTRKIKDEVMIPEKREIYQIGETYGTRELVGSYVNAGQLDAQFDFNVYDACLYTLANKDGSFKGLNAAVQASMDMFGHHHLMGNITGNQDKGRFISYAGGTLRFDENAKVAGWTREIDVGDPVAYKRAAQMIAVVATIPGLPVIYYGDEVGSYGGNDPDNRKMMFFEDLSDEQSGLLKEAQNVLNFRKGQLAFVYGDMRVHHVEDDTYAFSRNYFNDRALVVFNKSDEATTLKIELDRDQSGADAYAQFGANISESTEKEIIVELASNSFDIITLN